MTVIHYPQLDALLAAEPPAPLWLIHGEALLVGQALARVVARILPDPAGFHLETLDGATTDAAEALARANTYGLVPGPKVVVLKEARLFQSRADGGRLFEAARKACGEGDFPAAGRALAQALALEGLGVDDLGATGEEGLPAGWDAGEDSRWLAALLAYLRENPPPAKAAGDEVQRLEAELARGLPPGHHLILTAETVDRRRSLYARIESLGAVVDCTVPVGERKAEREAQAAVLMRQAEAVLAPRGKRLDREAFAALCDTTGFQLGVFTRNLELLADYVGERSEIGAGDVRAALARTRPDPLFEFTDAATDRRWDRAVGLLAGLLANDLHPLQLLAALVNQVRRLLLARGFLESPAGSAWRRDCRFDEFRAAVLPRVVAYDRERLAQAEAWERELAGGAPAPGKRAGKAKPKAASDLVLARSPANAYPLYQLLRKAERFTRPELEGALVLLSAADLQLKSSTVSPRLALERVLRVLCAAPQPPGPTARPRS